MGRAVDWKSDAFWGGTCWLRKRLPARTGSSWACWPPNAASRGPASTCLRQGAGQWAGRRPGPLHILGNGVALALVDPAGTLALDIRGRRLGVTVAEPPFVRVRVRA